MEVGDSDQLLLCFFGESGRDAEVFEQVVELLGCGLEVILVHVMAYAVNDHDFEPALHLGNH